MMKSLVALMLALSIGSASAQVLIPSSEAQWQKQPFPPSGSDSLFMLQPEQPGVLRYSLISFSQLVTSGALTPNITLQTNSSILPIATSSFVAPAGGAIMPENGFGPIGASAPVAGWISFVDQKGVTRYISYH